MKANFRGRCIDYRNGRNSRVHRRGEIIKRKVEKGKGREGRQSISVVKRKEIEVGRRKWEGNKEFEEDVQPRE